MTCTIASDGSERCIPHQNEYEAPYPAIKRSLLSAIQTLFQEGCTDFYVNCENGIPLWAAECICLLKKTEAVRLHIAVPFEEQSAFWNEDVRDRYFRLHRLADSITFVHTRYAETCYHDTDAFMTEHSDLVLVFGSPSPDLYITDYARNEGIQVKYASYT